MIRVIFSSLVLTAFLAGCAPGHNFSIAMANPGSAPTVLQVGEPIDQPVAQEATVNIRRVANPTIAASVLASQARAGLSRAGASVQISVASLHSRAHLGDALGPRVSATAKIGRAGTTVAANAKSALALANTHVGVAANGGLTAGAVVTGPLAQAGVALSAGAPNATLNLSASATTPIIVSTVALSKTVPTAPLLSASASQNGVDLGAAIAGLNTATSLAAPVPKSTPVTTVTDALHKATSKKHGGS